MNKAVVNPIWGEKVESFLTISSGGLKQARNVVPVERQLYTFLKKQIDEFQPDQIILLERKGTAILRAITERKNYILDWSWDKAIASTVVHLKPADYFTEKRILIFDDMLQSGVHLMPLLERLEKYGIDLHNKKQFRLAVFAVHEEGSRGLDFRGRLLPVSAFYRNLASEDYHRIRNQIVRMLQEAGSLMLDTEHIELRLRIKGNLNQLLNALRRSASTMFFHTTDSRTNITVFYEDDLAHQLKADRYPEGSELGKIVKKCRVVQRDGDEYAIIPICFPAIPKETEWLALPEDRELLGTHYLSHDLGRFYGAGLIAALDVLKWVIKDLAASLEFAKDYSLSLPIPRVDHKTTDGYSLEHLLVMYPELNLKKLTQMITKVQRKAQSEGAKLRRVRAKGYKSPIFSDEQLYEDAILLLQLIQDMLDERQFEIEQYEQYDEGRPKYPSALRAREVFELGRKLGWEDIRISTLFDILIDEAFIVPKVEEVKDENGRSFLVRIFGPGEETVRQLIRRYTYQWGLKYVG